METPTHQKVRKFTNKYLITKGLLGKSQKG